MDSRRRPRHPRSGRPCALPEFDTQVGGRSPAPRAGFALPVNSRVLKSTFSPSRFSESARLAMLKPQCRPAGPACIWQGKKDSNLRMSESKSDALTNLATPLHRFAVFGLTPCSLRTCNYRPSVSRQPDAHPTSGCCIQRAAHSARPSPPPSARAVVRHRGRRIAALWPALANTALPEPGHPAVAEGCDCSQAAAGLGDRGTQLGLRRGLQIVVPRSRRQVPARFPEASRSQRRNSASGVQPRESPRLYQLR